MQGGELVVPCNLQSTTVGPTSLSRGKLVLQAVMLSVMKLRSCATVSREPSQSLTAAALSEPSSVPQGSFSGAEAKPNYKMTCFKIGRIFYQTKNRVVFYPAFLFNKNLKGNSFLFTFYISTNNQTLIDEQSKQ